MAFDGVLRVEAPLGARCWTQLSYSLRREIFRYLTLVVKGGKVTLTRMLSVISFVWHILRMYQGYFYGLDGRAEGVDLLIKGKVFMKWGCHI